MTEGDKRNILNETRNRAKLNIFSPINETVPRQNCKIRFLVEADGSVTEHVALQVSDPSHREELILQHYLRHYAFTFAGVPMGIEIMSRDDPWDFDISVSQGDRFFVEITAIADSRFQFERDKREERLLRDSHKRELPLRDVRKLADMFPSDEVAAYVRSLAETAIGSNVPNPFFGDFSTRFIQGVCQRPSERLVDQIVEAIDRKSAKKHAGKDNTVLILDYRSNFPSSEGLAAARDELTHYLDRTPFPEILIYVGYFSDDTGNNAEFSIAPLKLSDEREKRLSELTEGKDPDALGRLVW